jgi:hypothetical protein
VILPTYSLYTVNLMKGTTKSVYGVDNSGLLRHMDMDERQAMNEVVSTHPSDNGESPAASDELDFASEVRQQLAEVRQQNSEVRQQISKVIQQNTEVTQQVSLLSQMFHNMQSTLMLQTEELQQMKSKEQHLYSLSAADMQQAKTTERHALMDNTCQSVQVAGAVAGIGSQQPADNKKEQDVAMPHQISAMQSAVKQTRIADNLLLERLEQMAKSERLFSIAEHCSYLFNSVKYDCFVVLCSKTNTAHDAARVLRVNHFSWTEVYYSGQCHSSQTVNLP